MNTHKDIVDIKQEIYSLPNYPKYVMDAFKYKDYDFIKKACNISIFREMRDSNYQTKHTDKHWGISYYIYYPIINLQKIIKLLLDYYNKISTSNTDDMIKLRNIIIGISIDYFFIMGKSKSFLDKIIKCELWGILELIHNISPINSSKDITETNINDNCINILIKMNINYTTTCRSLFIFNDYNKIIKYINKYDTKTILNNIKYIKNTDIYDYLIKNNIISLNKLFIKEYHKECHLQLLIYLVKKQYIISRKKYLEHIFKHPSIRDRHEILWYDFFNTKAKGNKFRKYIIEYLDILKDNNIYVNVNLPFIKCMLYNKLYDYLTNYLFKTNKKNIPKQLKNILLEHYIKNDNIDIFNSFIDNNIIKIQELHSDEWYIVNIIKNNSYNIGNYVINTLKVKWLTFLPSKLWGWHIDVATNITILNNIEFMTKYNIYMDKKKIITSMLANGKHSKLIDKLINNYGMVIEKKHLCYMANYSLNKIRGYTQHIKYNKIKYIYSLISQTKIEYIALFKQCNNLAIKLIQSTCHNNDIEKYYTYALIHNNTSLFEKLQQIYDIKLNIDNIRKIITSKSCRINGFVLLKYLSNDLSIEEITNDLPNDVLISSLLINPIVPQYKTSNITLMKKFKIIPTYDMILYILHQQMNSYSFPSDIQEETKFISELIKFYIEHHPDKSIEMLELLLKNNNIQVILNLEMYRNDIINYFTREKLYSELLDVLVNGINSTYIIKLIIIIQENTNILTPYIYKIITTGHYAINNNPNIRIFEKLEIPKSVLIELVNVYPDVLEEDKQYINDYIIPELDFNVVEYKCDDNDIPYRIDYYSNLYNNNVDIDDIIQEIDDNIDIDVQNKLLNNSS